jgi:twinkle protein
VPTAAGCEPLLFGWQAMPVNVRVAVITEGEIDALSWAACGYDALSVPFGGGNGRKQHWIENEYERMQQFERIYLATDMYEEGEKAAKEIAARLGLHCCLRVKMPRKDGNACLVEGVTKATMDEAIAKAGWFSLPGRVGADDLRTMRPPLLRRSIVSLDHTSLCYPTPPLRGRDPSPSCLGFRPS